METNARDVFIQNINRIMKEKNKSQKQISTDLKIPLSTVSSWVNGQSYPRVDKMQKLADYLNVSMRALTDKTDQISNEEIFSQNLMHYMKIKNASAKEISEFCKVSENEFEKWLCGKVMPKLNKIQILSVYFSCSISDLIEIKDNNISKSHGIKIPVLGRVVAGIPIEAIEEILDYEEISESTARTGDYFALQVKGDSMEPRMYEGDVVIVRKQETAQTGDVAIVLINGDEATVKKIRIMDSGIMLIPFNTKYDPWIYTAEDIERLPVKIIGKVVECRQKY